MRMIAPAATCNNILRRCKWKNTLYRCDQLFQRVFTMLSLCCTFNYFAIASKVNLPGNKILHPSTPRRVASCGYQTALTVLINTDFEDYYSTSIASQGALVYVDNAYNIPNLNSPVRMVNPSTEVLIALSPESTYSTSGVKAFTPGQRQCYYKNEIKIGMFQHYSFHNCLTLELAMMIKHYCQCIPFFIPTKEHHRSCDFNDLNCLELLLTTANNKHAEDSYDINMTCLPECEYYIYPLEVSVGTRLENFPINRDPFYNDVNLENISTLNVFFNDLVSTRYRRDVYLNWQNILAAFGGLLSLILGFTLITGCDLILFFILRIIYDGVKTIFAGETNPDNKIHVADANKRDVLTKKRLNRPRDRQNIRIRDTDAFENNKY